MKKLFRSNAFLGVLGGILGAIVMMAVFATLSYVDAAPTALPPDGNPTLNLGIGSWTELVNTGTVPAGFADGQDNGDGTGGDVYQAGNFYQRTFCIGHGMGPHRLRCDGDVTTDSAGRGVQTPYSMYASSFDTSSDSRLKENITDLGSVLDKVNQLNPANFEMKDQPGTKLGLIAQEVELLFPEAVSENSEGYKAIDYSQITTALIKAIQEQQEEIDQLKTGG